MVKPNQKLTAQKPIDLTHSSWGRELSGEGLTVDLEGQTHLYVMPIIRRRKLRHREVKELSQVAQLGSDRART